MYIDILDGPQHVSSFCAGVARVPLNMKTLSGLVPLPIALIVE